MLGEHNRLVRGRLERYLGEEVNTTGDGFLAMFASARGAIRCAASIRDATAGIGLPVRIGVHTGEVELLPGDIGGVAVHAAARVMALGGASDIMVSSSTRGLVEGDDLRFESRGAQEFKGLVDPARGLHPRRLIDNAMPAPHKRRISAGASSWTGAPGPPRDCDPAAAPASPLDTGGARCPCGRLGHHDQSDRTRTRSVARRFATIQEVAEELDIRVDLVPRGGRVTWTAC